MANERILLVAGYDYAQSGVDFRPIVNNRKARLLKTFPDATVIIFDVRAGEVVTSEQPPTPAGKKKKPARTETKDTTTFKGVTKKNYSGADPDHPHTFDTNPTGVISITDIYQAIINLGAAKDTKGTLKEFSIFSHGWKGGAILVDSNDTSTTEARDPDDKDTRLKDFKPKNISAADLTSFKAAFAADGYCRLWGCAFTHTFFQVISKLLKNPKYRKTKPGALKDTDEFEFEFGEDQAKDLYTQNPFFPQPVEEEVVIKKKKVKRLKFELKFKRTWKDIKDFLDRGRQTTYAQVLATAAGKTCYAAFLGTYADYESNDPKAKQPLMIVPRKVPPYADDFTKIIKFYKDVIKIPEDPESRGYGTYTP